MTPGKIRTTSGPTGHETISASERRVLFKFGLRLLVRSISISIPTLGVHTRSRAGKDDNGDLSTNDRPAGVERNSLRGPGQYQVNLNWNSPPINIRKKKAPDVAPTGAAGPPTAAAAMSREDALIQSALQAGLPLGTIQQLILANPGLVGATGTGTPTTPTAPPTLLHPRVTFRVQIQNLLNNTRINGYSGVITSPLFGRPTGYGAGRSIQLSLNTQF